MILVIFGVLLCVIIWGKEIEVCENKKAFIHHNFGTPECLPLIVRRFGDPYTWCENQGTWEGERFKCYFPSEDEGGYCKYGESSHSQTCIPKVIKTAEVWIEPNENIQIDWEWNILNLDIRGNMGNIQINGSVFEDVYNYTGFKTHLAATLNYNETCQSTLNFFINGTKVLEVDENLDYYWLILIRAMIEVDEEIENNEKVYSVFSWDCVLDEDQIQYLYSLGSDRAFNTTIIRCCNVGDFEIVQSRLVYSVISWILVSILGTALLLVLFFYVVRWCFNVGKKDEGYRKLDEQIKF